MGDERMTLLKGTLDLLVLRALEAGPRHGYGVARWLDRATDGTLLPEEGTLYPALHRLERKGWIQPRWGRSEKGRRARFYSLTEGGRTRLDAEREGWTRYVEAVGKALAHEPLADARDPA